MKLRSAKGDKREVRQETRLTRPPRLEGKAKEAMMQPVRKPARKRPKPHGSRKMQGYTASQRKNYQLKSKKTLI